MDNQDQDTCGSGAIDSPAPGGGNSGHGPDVGASPEATPSASAQSSDATPATTGPEASASGADASDAATSPSPVGGMYSEPPPNRSMPDADSTADNSAPQTNADGSESDATSTTPQQSDARAAAPGTTANDTSAPRTNAEGTESDANADATGGETSDATDDQENQQCAAPPAPAPDPVDVKVMDKTESDQWNAANPDGVEGGRSPADYFNTIEQQAGGNPIRNVDIIDHGHEGSQNMGDGDVSPNIHDLQNGDPSAAGVDDMYKNLGQHMTDDGQVNLRGCRVGGGSDGSAYLDRIAGDTQHPVNAATETQYPGAPPSDGMATGPYQGPVKTCVPNAAGPGTATQCGVTDPANYPYGPQKNFKTPPGAGPASYNDPDNTSHE